MFCVDFICESQYLKRQEIIVDGQTFEKCELKKKKTSSLNVINIFKYRPVGFSCIYLYILFMTIGNDCA